MRMIPPAGLSLCVCLCVCSLPYVAQAQMARDQLQFLAMPTEASDFAIEGWIKAPDGWPRGGEVHVAFNYLDERRCYYARFTADAVQLFKVTGGKATRIGRDTGIAPGTLGKDVYFAIKRHRWRIAVVCGDALAAMAFDDEYAGGGTGTAVTGRGLSLEEVAMQEMAPILLTDDFVREGGRMADWEAVRGTWQSTGIASAQQYANRNANAFAFAGIAEDFALATAGYWFWDSYDFSASVKPESTGAVGLACCVAESDTYLLFRWTAGAGGSKQLIAVRGDERQVLAEEPGGYEPGQWYKLTLRSQWSDLQALVDGQLAVRARAAPLAQGGIGLYVEGGRSLFDDVHVEDYESFRDDFASDDGTAWRAESGQWRASDGVLRVTPAKRGGGPSRAVAGRDDWKDYVFAADVKPAGGGTVGLCFGYHSKDDYYAFAWDGPSKTASMYHVHGGSVTSLAKAPLPYQPGERHRLKVATDRGYLRAYVDNKLVLDALAPEGAEGKVGVLAGGPSTAWFDDAVVWFVEPAYEEPPITEQFTAEATMASWAGPLREWMYVRGQAPRLYLTKRTFYDDVELSMLLPALREDTEFGVVLCTGPEALDRAARLRLTPGATAGEVKVVLTRGATTLHEGGAAIVPESTDNVLRFGRRGPHLYVVVGDALVCQVKDPDPARGIRVGLQVQNAYVRLTRTQLKAANVCDYTFSRAPTDWYQQRGTWASTDRWPCQRGWAWLAGTQDVVPMLWTKRAFTGDMTVEVWSAMVMDLPRTPGYSHPSDVNVSICGNGRDVSSGYSFIYAGLNNTASMVMRGSQLIAKNESMRFIDPVSSNPNFHRHWFHSRIEKRGSHISYHVDGRLVAEFDDPEALEGGHVALWTTNNNGLIVARARISYSEGGEITPLPQLRVHGEPVLAADGGPVRIVEPVRMPLHNDFEDNVGQWRQAGRGRRAALALNALQPAEIRSSRRITTGNVTTFAFGGGRGLFPLAVGPEGVPQQVGAGTQDVVLSLDSSTQSQGKRSLRITNANTGGQFSVVAVPGAFRVGDAPVLSFDYRLPPEVKVNIHFTVNGRAHAIVFSGDESLSARRLGQIEDVVADGKWHTARFDLLAALADVYPATADLEIRGLGFASRSTDMYRVAGFGGNYWGSSYNIDNFRLGRAI